MMARISPFDPYLHASNTEFPGFSPLIDTPFTFVESSFVARRFSRFSPLLSIFSREECSFFRPPRENLPPEEEALSHESPRSPIPVRQIEKNTRIFAKSFPRTENSSRENENRDRFEVSSLPLRFFSRTLYFLLTKIARFNLLNTIRIIFQLIIKFQRIDKVTSI